MNGVFAAPFAILLKFKLTLNFFLIFRHIIITPFADGTAKPDEVFRVL